MKKVIVAIVVIALLAVVVDKLFFSKTAAAEDGPEMQPLSVSKNSEVFNTAFDKLLNSYFSLKSVIADYDSSGTARLARETAAAANAIPLQEVKGDTTGFLRKTAADFVQSISTSANDMAGNTSFDAKKHDFYTLSDALYNLVRTVRYDRQVLYHQHCPMAFNDTEEAWWLSNSRKIDNPYMGRKHPKYHASMSTCGDVTDSLDFRK